MPLLPKANFIFKCQQSCFLVSCPVILSILFCMGGGGCGWVCLHIQQEQLLDDPGRWPRQLYVLFLASALNLNNKQTGFQSSSGLVYTKLLAGIQCSFPSCYMNRIGKKCSEIYIYSKNIKTKHVLIIKLHVLFKHTKIKNNIRNKSICKA